MSQEELGDRVGVSGQDIGQLERGEKSNPSREIIERISQVLDIPWEGLLYGNDAREGLSEQDILTARAVRNLPLPYQLEVQAVIVRGMMAAAQQKEQQAAKETTSDS